MIPQGMESQYTRISLPVKCVWNPVVTSREEETRMSLRHTIEKEGLYYVMVGRCQAKTSNVALSGYSAAKNTYGELPATLYGELPFNSVLIGLFSLGLLYWMITCYRHAKSILSVHRIIKAHHHIIVSSVVYPDFVCCGVRRLQSQRSRHELQGQFGSRPQSYLHSHSLHFSRPLAPSASLYCLRVLLLLFSEY